MFFARPRKEVTTTGRKISQMCRSVFKLQSIPLKSKRVVPSGCSNHHNTGQCQYQMQADDVRSFKASTHKYGNQNAAHRIATPLKIRHYDTLVLSFVVRENQSLHLSLCCIVMKSQNNCLRTDSLNCCKRRPTNERILGVR